MKRVYFNLRTSSRERMWDTARASKRVCVPITPNIKQRTSLARAASYQTRRHKIVRACLIVVRKLPLINYQSTPAADTADVVYMWGAFPRHTKKPFIIEFDNPFVITYYHQFYFRLLLPFIRRKLSRALRVTFLSETARNHFLELCGQQFAEKTVTLPPFMAENYKTNKRPDDGNVRFLFVGLDFRRKGGPELLAAFAKLTHPNARLTIVAPVPDKFIEQYAHDTRITFLPPQSRQVLLTELYPSHDIFVFPSLLETLGVVILEALSFGMGIITTDNYATPEMIQDGKNGILLKHPFLEHQVYNGVSIIDPVSIHEKQFTKQYLSYDHFYESLAEDTLFALQKAMVQVKTWQKNSEEHFKNTYAPQRWEERLKSILESNDNKKH